MALAQPRERLATLSQRGAVFLLGSAAAVKPAPPALDVAAERLTFVYVDPAVFAPRRDPSIAVTVSRIIRVEPV